MSGPWPYLPGVPAAGHITSGGWWHPGRIEGCPKCRTNDETTEDGMAHHKEMKRLRQRLTAQGFDVQQVPNGHYRVVAPSGAKVQIAATPGSGRSILNMVTRLRRIGYDHRA